LIKEVYIEKFLKKKERNEGEKQTRKVPWKQVKWKVGSKTRERKKERRGELKKTVINRKEGRNTDQTALGNCEIA
jgi:hypothetical protein